jgi:hypothetical protein
MILFNQLVFDTPRLRHFTGRTQILKSLNQARISFFTSHAVISLPWRDGMDGYYDLSLQTSCRAPDWQLSSLAQLCTSSFPPLSTLEHLEIRDNGQHWHDDMEHTQWIELLHPFISVKDLIVSEELVHVVSPALQELVGERVAEVLPALQNIFLGGLQPSNPVREAIVNFIVARRLSDHPVTVYHQDKPGQEYVRWGIVDR